MRGRLRAAVIAFCAMLAVVFSVGTPTASADSFRGWTYDVSVGGNDGLRLDDVYYQGTKVFERISLPVMNVFYQNNVCGPYTDMLGGASYDGPFGTDFTLDGVRWRSIGITDQLGQYEITMYYYLSEHGDFDAHIFSRGIQCNSYHEHLPFWRMDFDVAGAGNDEIVRRSGNGSDVVESNEFSLPATAAAEHDWEVRDRVTGDRVTIAFDDGTFTIPGEVIPETDYQNNKVYGRQYRSSETTWQGGASRGLFGDNGESINDVVLWYSGFMPHTSAEGPSLWHSTGIRLRVNPGEGESSTIGDRVSNIDGSGAPGVAVDLFVQQPNGSRGAWLGSATTNGNGNYGFTVDPGCYTVVFIAPQGRSFQGGGQYLERSTCVSGGQDDLGLDAVLLGGNGSASIGDRVTFAGGGGASGVVVDLFADGGNGARGAWLGNDTTDGNGNYGFPVAAGCYVVVFIAPDGSSFVGGGAYDQRNVCVAAGETRSDVDAVLVGGAGAASIGDRVSYAGGGGASGVDVDLFVANGDGSRGPWLTKDTTDGNGNYGFPVAAGCYVVVFIAPGGSNFVGGGAYDQRNVCVAAGETRSDVDAVLA